MKAIFKSLFFWLSFKGFERECGIVGGTPQPSKYTVLGSPWIFAPDFMNGNTKTEQLKDLESQDELILATTVVVIIACESSEELLKAYQYFPQALDPQAL